MSKRSRTAAFKQSAPPKHHFEEEKEEDEEDINQNSDSETDNEIEVQMGEMEKEKLIPISKPNTSFYCYHQVQHLHLKLLAVECSIKKIMVSKSVK